MMKANIDAGYHQFVDPETGEKYGSFEVFEITERDLDIFGNVLETGWHWWPCFPGCLPDGDASGPFITSTHARWNAIDSI